MSTISNFLADYVADGDLHTQLENVEYSTNLRVIVTVGYMIDHYKAEKEKTIANATA
ncbi:hypothetical protein [Caenibacillus caldisaponilyticus]|uniref:hypothetical protein n=1 Tax=Caenibacillus caldisaponilyticus TaxID=1674942 RepID=UPI0013010470|nr:hypothetical protein [Caenibacillus caldisaponilyticus]